MIFVYLFMVIDKLCIVRHDIKMVMYIVFYFYYTVLYNYSLEIKRIPTF